MPNNLVNKIKHLPTGLLAVLFYRWPARNLKIIGVTGTDGKTTTANYIYHLLSQAGFKVALISTIAAKMGNKNLDTGLHVTSLEHFALQKLLRKIADKGYQYLVLEVTSHGLAQYRFCGINFFIGVVTNVSNDHLDYHGNWTKYLYAKAKLFKNTKYSVLNKEDKSFKFLSKVAKGKVISYGLKKGDLNLTNLGFLLPIVETYNQLNFLAAVAVADTLGISRQITIKSLINLPKIKGRMEIMSKNPLIVVDFAHTQNALKQALTSLRKRLVSKGRLIAVFGCAGERDKLRRRMGKISCQLADLTIITAEDPRAEGVKKISTEIAKWARKGGGREINTITDFSRVRKRNVFIRIDDRKQAIASALKIAHNDDIVGIFGKGHEKSMCFGSQEYSWSDQKIVKNLLSRKRKK